MEDDQRYMRRALDLALKGIYFASPNPMVGAVIVDDEGRIIGEGYHRRCGGAHAEVNAIESVADKEALKRSTMYVTLEPCSHYGRTGPCADLIIKMGIPRVVIGTRDPFDKVDGRGIERLRQAGIDVRVGVMEYACRALNAIFFTAHTLHRPFIALKWAQSADGYIDAKRMPGEEHARISVPLTTAYVHRMRSIFDAILVGSGTVLADNPRLDVRHWGGDAPIPIVLDRRGRVGKESRIMQRDPIIIRDDKPLADIMADLYQRGITSVMVEGGRQVLQSFLDARLWDVCRIEIGPTTFGEYGSVKAPEFDSSYFAKLLEFEGNIVKYCSQNPLIDVKNL